MSCVCRPYFLIYSHKWQVLSVHCLWEAFLRGVQDGWGTRTLNNHWIDVTTNGPHGGEHREEPEKWPQKAQIKKETSRRQGDWKGKQRAGNWHTQTWWKTVPTSFTRAKTMRSSQESCSWEAKIKGFHCGWSTWKETMWEKIMKYTKQMENVPKNNLNYC